MNARIFTGTLIGPEGQTVGRFVKYEAAHNLQQQIDALRDGLTMLESASSLTEAQAIAADLILGHDRALAAAGTSH